MQSRYGTSTYRTTNHHRREPEPQGFWQKHPHIKLALKLLALLFVLGFILLWAFLGEFRFLLTRWGSFAGLPFGSRHYLVVVQNADELRPTGGVITYVGIATYKNGLYRGTDFEPIDSIDIEDIEAPLAVSALFADDSYSFVDANTDPDFATTAQNLMNLYREANPTQKLDGVVAMDLDFLTQSLGQDLLTADSEALEKLFQKRARKNTFLPWTLRGTLNEFTQAFQGKDMLAYFERPGLQEAFASRQWTGSLPSSEHGDFLAINDANYSRSFSNRYVTRDVEYELKITDEVDILGNPVVDATVTITLTHHGDLNPPFSDTYKSYLRTMLPLGADLISKSSVKEDRSDAEVFAELIELEPGESLTLTYEYELPEYVWINGQYSLHLHKQPGTNADRYRVILHAPQDISLQAPQFTVHENIALLDTRLATDLNLRFSLSQDENPPRLIRAEITELNEVVLEFNESLDSSAKNPTLYSVGELVILDIEQKGNKIVLFTQNMQNNESYELSIPALTDTKGNQAASSSQTIRANVQEELDESPDSGDNAGNE